MPCGAGSVFSSPSTTQTTFSSLPHEVLVQVLQHVDQQQLLCNCANVSTRFRSAAMAACSSIELLRTDSFTKWSSLMKWLHTHGNTVTSLALRSPYMALVESLPCSRLHTLYLDGVAVLLTRLRSTADQGLLHSSCALTSLWLHGCTVLDTTENLSALSRLSELQHITVTSGPTAAQALQHSPPAITMLPGSLLSQLLQLRSISMDAHTVFSSLQHISCLTLLQRLDLMLHTSTQCEELAGLERLQNLTCLNLGCMAQNPLSISVTTTPGFAHLTSLKVLMLQPLLSLDPTVLEGMVDLQYLSLHGAQLAGGAAGTSALFAVLTAIAHLTVLELNSCLWHCAPQQAAYAALGALTQLDTLQLVGCVVPEGLWQQLAAAGLCMLSVRTLMCHHINTSDTCLDAAELAALVSCFPQLRDLHCTSATKPGTEYSALQGFSSLTYLVLDNVGDGDVPVLTGLQGLQLLHVPTSSITDYGLMQLTSLTALTLLEVTGGLSTAVSDYGGLPAAGTLSIRNQVPALLDPSMPHYSNVPQQLLQRCMCSPVCSPYLLHELLGQRLELVQLRNEIASHQAILAEVLSGTSNQDSISGLGGGAAAPHLSTAAAAGGYGSGATCSTAAPPAEGPASSQQ